MLFFYLFNFLIEHGLAGPIAIAPAIAAVILLPM